MKNPTRVAHAIERLILSRMEAAGIFIQCNIQTTKALQELDNLLSETEPKKETKKRNKK